MTKKRMNGEGSWTKRDNGTWKLSVSYKGVGRKYFYGTKQECLDKKRKFEALLSSNIVGDKDILFKDFIRAWLKEIKQPAVKANSYDRLEYVTESTLINRIGNLSLKQIDDNLIQTMVINKMKEEGYAHATIKKTYSTLGQALKYAAARGKIDKNPMNDVFLPNRSLFENKKIRFLSDEERNRLVTTCYMTFQNGGRIYKFGTFYVFLLYTGLRLGEALALKWSDIDLEKRTVNVSRTIVYVRDRSKNDGSKILLDQTSTKNGMSRVVYLSDMAIEALYDLKKQMGYDPNGYIMQTKNKTILYPADVYKIFQRILKRANIEQCGIHALRHSFVSLMINNGIPITMVSQMAGHANIGITMKIYTHLLEETQLESMSIIKNLK
jgi:integrase